VAGLCGDAFDDLFLEDITGPSGVPWDFAMRNHVLGSHRFMSDDASVCSRAHCLLLGTVHLETRLVVCVDAFDDLFLEDITGPSGVPWDFAMRNHVLGGHRFMSDDASDVGDNKVLDERHVFNVHKRVHLLLVNKELFVHGDGESYLGEFFEDHRQLDRRCVCDVARRHGIALQNMQPFFDQPRVKRVDYDLPAAHIPVGDGSVSGPPAADIEL